jgi:MSHA biogenesis protein MshQ
VGDATRFTPVNISAGTTTTAGSLTVTTTSTEHPQVTTPIVSTGIDAANDIARYWTFATSTLTVGTQITATFTFVAGDVDAGANTANFIAERYDGTNWNPTTLVAANATSTQVSNITLPVSGSNDFAIGDPRAGFNGYPGAFNVFESSTPAGSVLGRIYTKLVSTGFSLDVVAVNANRNGVNAAYNTNPITVVLLDSRDNTGAVTLGTNCRASWATVLFSQNFSPIWTNGRATVAIPAFANAARDVRIRVTQGANSGCSTDRFSIRPTAFSSITSTANNNGSGAGTTFKTGANFTINALTGLTGYDNGSGNTLANPQLIPLVDNTMIIGSPTAGSIGGTFGAASSGTATGAAFYYSEAGNFGLNNNLATTATNAAIYDNVFSSVDQASGDCVAGSFSNALSGGKYGCNFGNAVIPQTTGSSGFGRFIPDNFNVVFNSPQFGTACSAGSFTYVGQAFSYATAPQMTVTARSGTNNGLTNTTTQNYQGAYMKLSNAAGTSLNQAPYNTQAGRYSRFDALGGGTTPALDTSLLPATTADPAIGAFANGVGTLTFSSGSGLDFVRSNTTPNAPFSGDIALALNVVDTDAVAFGSNPASFGTATSGGGIAFSSGKTMRFGRLRMYGATGVLTLNLQLQIQAEYWTGTGFTLNKLDSCTSLVRSNIALGTYAVSYPLAACATFVNSTPVTLSSGSGLIVLTAPGTGKQGSLTLTPQLGSSAAGQYCTAVGGAGNQAATTAAAISYLQGPWGGVATYDQNPSARAAFGVYGAQPNNYIFFREDY